MRTLVFILLFIPLVSFSQKTETYLKLVNSSGQQLKGDAVKKGFERWITLLSTTQGGKNNTQLTFTMNIGTVSADFRKALSNGEILLNGEMKTIQLANDGMSPVTYSIKMENIKVVSYSESRTQASVTLQASRIGFTYYQQSTKGTWTISNKYSYDAETGGEWKGF